MRKWVAGVSFCLAVILFGIAGWNFFQHRYCNAERLNQELAATHRPALLDEFIAQDRQRRDDELRQILCGGVLLVLAGGLWSGWIDPEDLPAWRRRRLAPHA
ncbi:MAG: hypothetical protein ACP5M4_06815 [Acidobacteriaceae bacterium]